MTTVLISRVRLATCGAVLAVATMGADSCSTSDEKPLGGANEPTQQAEEESAPEALKTEGKSNLACAYELGGGTTGDPFAGYRFTAGGTLTNAGDTNIRVRVTYQWKRLGSAPKKVKKIYRVRAGEERDVNVSIKASQPDISAHQNAPDPACKATAKILGTY